MPPQANLLLVFKPTSMYCVYTQVRYEGVTIDLIKGQTGVAPSGEQVSHEWSPELEKVLCMCLKSEPPHPEISMGDLPPEIYRAVPGESHPYWACPSSESTYSGQTYKLTIVVRASLPKQLQT